MKINFARLKKVEEDYMDNPICLNTIQRMVDIVMTNDMNTPEKLASVAFAMASLKDLGILTIQTEEKKKDLLLS